MNGLDMAAERLAGEANRHWCKRGAVVHIVVADTDSAIHMPTEQRIVLVLEPEPLAACSKPRLVAAVARLAQGVCLKISDSSAERRAE